MIILVCDYCSLFSSTAITGGGGFIVIISTVIPDNDRKWISLWLGRSPCKIDSWGRPTWLYRFQRFMNITFYIASKWWRGIYLFIARRRREKIANTVLISIGKHVSRTRIVIKFMVHSILYNSIRNRSLDRLQNIMNSIRSVMPQYWCYPGYG